MEDKSARKEPKPMLDIERNPTSPEKPKTPSSPRIGRRGFLGLLGGAIGAAVVAGVASKLPIPSVEAASGPEPTTTPPPERPKAKAARKESSELAQEFSYEVIDVSVNGDGVMYYGAEFNDGKRYIVKAELNTTTGTLDQNTSKEVDFDIRSVSMSTTDPNFGAAVGYDGSKGIIEITEDGWATTIREEVESIGFMSSDQGIVQISPDNQFIVVSFLKNSEGPIVMFRLDRDNNNAVVETPVTFQGLPENDDQAFVQMTEIRDRGDGTFVNEAILLLDSGYVEIVYAQDGSIQAERKSASDGRGREVIQFDDQGTSRTGFLSNNTTSPDNPGHFTGTLFDIHGSTKNEVQPKVSLYSPVSGSIFLTRATLDTISREMFLGIQTSENNKHSFYIEVADLDDPENLDKRELVERNGSFPTESLSGNSIRSINVLEKNGERYLVVSLKSTDPNANGIHIKRITDGLNNPGDEWKKAAVTISQPATPTPTPEKKRQFLPAIFKRLTGSGW